MSSYFGGWSGGRGEFSKGDIVCKTRLSPLKGTHVITRRDNCNRSVYDAKKDLVKNTFNENNLALQAARKPFTMQHYQ